MNTSPESTTSGAVHPEEVSAGYKNYVLALLVVVYVFNFVDRTILSILLEPIKAEFDLSDTQLGFLSGLAFALFYTFMGIPIARWADRGVRRTIIAISLFTWSAMTAFTGAAQNFGMLLAARVGVGVGEAGCSPPAHSLLSDYFPAQRRATALAIYSLGIPIGSGIGYLAGGWLAEWFDWRTAFVVVGLPGVLLAGVVQWTLREPVRGAYDPPAPETARKTFREVLDFLLARRSFRHMALGAALHAFYGYGAGAFNPAFFVRSHGLSIGEIGTWLAAIGFTGGVLGTYLGGYLSDRIADRDVRWYMWLPALSTALYVPFVFLLYLWPTPYGALALALPGSLLGSMYLGPTFAMTQTLVRPEMRAVASAILLFIINLIGLGFGPQGVGFLSDLLAPSFGVESLRYALLTVVVVFACWSVLEYTLAARTLREDLESRDAL
jgi:MFS family permease